MTCSEASSSEGRSSMRVSKTRGGEYTWSETVAAADNNRGALEDAVALARRVEAELAELYTGRTR